MHLVSVYSGLAIEMKLSGNNSFISGMRADTGTSTADLGLSGLHLRRCRNNRMMQSSSVVAGWQLTIVFMHLCTCNCFP